GLTMASATMASRLLSAADSLLQAGGRSVAFRRRAVSTAYYAVFHALAKLARSAPADSEEYARVYRSLDHGPLRTAFTQAPRKDSPRQRKIGSFVGRLKAKGHRADYPPPIGGLFSRDAVRELLDLAREAIADLESLKPQNKES